MLASGQTLTCASNTSIKGHPCGMFNASCLLAWGHLVAAYQARLMAARSSKPLLATVGSIVQRLGLQGGTPVSKAPTETAYTCLQHQ